MQKINFFNGFFHSIFSPERYTEFLKLGALHVVFHFFSLIIILSIGFLIGLTGMFKFINKHVPEITEISSMPSFTVQEDKIIFDKNLKLPYIKYFNSNLESNRSARFFRIILDNSVENEKIYAQKLEDYMLITPDKIIFSSQKAGNIKTITAKEIQENKEFLKFFFSDELKFSMENFIKFGEFLLILVLFIGVPPFFIVFPLPSFLGIFSAITCLLVSIFIKFVFANYELKFSEIFKASVFALTPTVLIQTTACMFFMNNRVFIYIFILAWVIQAFYLLNLIGILNKQNN